VQHDEVSSSIGFLKTCCSSELSPHFVGRVAHSSEAGHLLSSLLLIRGPHTTPSPLFSHLLNAAEPLSPLFSETEGGGGGGGRRGLADEPT